MNNILIYLIVFFSTLVISDDYLSTQTFMKTNEIIKTFGNKELNESDFKNGNLRTRGQMASSLIKSKKFIGKSAIEVKSTLGDFTGHFWNDNIPAYLLEATQPKPREIWQLVFLLGEDSKIQEVKIHKNCCK